LIKETIATAQPNEFSRYSYCSKERHKNKDERLITYNIILHNFGITELSLPISLPKKAHSNAVSDRCALYCSHSATQ